MEGFTIFTSFATILSMYLAFSGAKPALVANNSPPAAHAELNLDSFPGSEVAFMSSFTYDYCGASSLAETLRKALLENVDGWAASLGDKQNFTHVANDITNEIGASIAAAQTRYANSSEQLPGLSTSCIQILKDPRTRALEYDLLRWSYHKIDLATALRRAPAALVLIDNSVSGTDY